MSNLTELTELQRAVIKQLGITEALIYETLEEEAKDTLKDVLRCGADAGWPGFIYYDDTIKFYDDNEKLIKQHLKDRYQDYGYNSIIEMVRSFNCFKQFKNNEIELFFMGMLDVDDDITVIKNGLSWYALEEVARELDPELVN